MIFISCDIENFGCLSRFHYDFDAGLNVFHADNGAGKSTFAAFLTAMLYGLNLSTRATLSENPRKLYTPWQGGLFGGSLTFFANGKRYRAVRTFGKKETEDTFQLYDVASESLSQDFPQNLGEALTGLSRSAYEKSVFISRLEKAPFAACDAAITEKLSAFVESSEDACTFDQAEKILEKQRKVYEKTGNRGKLYEIRAEIEEKKLLAMQLRREAEILDLYRREEQAHTNKLLHLEKEAEHLTEEAISVSAQDAHRALFQHAEMLRREVSDAENCLQTSRNSFGIAVPTEETLSLLEAESHRCSEMKAAADATHLSSVEEEELYRLSQIQSTVPGATDKKTNLPGAPSSKENASRRLSHPFLFLIGALAILSSIPCFFFLLPLALAVFGVGVSLLILSIFQKSASRNTESTINTAEPQNELRLCELLTRAEHLREEKKQMLARYEEARTLLLHSLASFGEEGNDEHSSLVSLRLRVMNHQSMAERLDNAVSRLSAFLDAHPDLSAQDNFIADEKTLPASSVTVEEKRRSNRAAAIAERNALTALREKIAPLAARVAQAEHVHAAIASLTLQETSAMRNLAALKGAASYLESARKALATRYLGKMQARLDRYLTLLLPSFDSRPIFDNALALTVENRGVRRDPLYFSKGTRDVLSFCMHLALSDALTEKEKPCLIIDDVFADYDEKKLTLAGTFLRELAKTTQILYFTCHSSRTLLP